jgi:hypothetical protein
MPGTFASIPAIDMSQQARHRTPFGGIVSTAEPLIRLPVHAFRLVGEPLNATCLVPILSSSASRFTAGTAGYFI